MLNLQFSILRPPVLNCKFSTPSKSVNYFWGKMKDAKISINKSKQPAGRVLAIEEEQMKKLRNVIFLDIDGVLQPGHNQYRFKHDLDKLREKLALKYKNDEYLEMDRYDLGAVYYDWDKDAVERLRKLCAQGPAEIVISSDWRSYSPLSTLKDYFRLHALDKYITGEIPQVSGKMRCDEITEYLQNNRNIRRFVILDDAHIGDFKTNYPKQFVYCRFIFDDDCYQKAIDILKP